jgi:uncharacterized protein (DUF305 family)
MNESKNPIWVVSTVILAALCAYLFTIKVPLSGSDMPNMNGMEHMGGMTMDSAGRGSGMHEAMSGMMMGLEGKTGAAFDQAFLSEMIMHHQGAVDMAELALTNAQHQEIKDLAKAIIAAQKKEIADMKAWQQAWFK